MGLPVLPGFTITAGAAATVGTTTTQTPALAAITEAWSELSAAGRRRLVVRSSSVAEDGAVSSMAGRFTPVLDVREWESFLAAVGKVVASASDEPMVSSFNRSSSLPGAA